MQWRNPLILPIVLKYVTCELFAYERSRQSVVTSLGILGSVRQLHLIDPHIELHRFLAC